MLYVASRIIDMSAKSAYNRIKGNQSALVRWLTISCIGRVLRSFKTTNAREKGAHVLRQLDDKPPADEK